MCNPSSNVEVKLGCLTMGSGDDVTGSTMFVISIHKHIPTIFFLVYFICVCVCFFSYLKAIIIVI